MMDTALLILLAIVIIWAAYKLFYRKGTHAEDYKRGQDSYDRGEVDRSTDKKTTYPIKRDVKSSSEIKVKKSGFFARLFAKPLPFDEEAIIWCANFLVVDKDELINILRDTSLCYSHFNLRKRSGGIRIISAPKIILLKMQKTIYQRILLPVNIHPAATGFRPNISIVQNAEVHLGKNEVLKVDIVNFFGSIKKLKVIGAFERIGYPSNIAKVLAELCTLDNRLPQGAPTSPALSNIISYDTDVKLAAFSQEKGLCYTRYADDLTFSGDKIDFEKALADIDEILFQNRFIIQRKKTRFLTEKKRKIVTGISISTGEKLTIPKATKRELRKNIHFILTKGLEEHKRFIGSTDPSYLKRIIGQLCFWQMIEPDNEYVKKSLAALKKL